MGVYLDKVKAVVSICGSVIATGNDLTYRGRELWKGFKFQGELLSCDLSKRTTLIESVMRDVLRHDHTHLIPVEKASEDTHFLMVAGDQDTTCSNYGVEAVSQRLEICGRADKVHTIVYPGAGHIIEPPYNTLCEHSHYAIGTIVYWGGEAQGLCRAEEDLWHQIRSCLAHHVRDRSQWYQDLLQKSRTKTDVA
ncbi:peroxisomal succinyl-coenzyme A thioesterase-like [Panulirus ornatus]|uniref:peroxisomal succinyl-coenzyme A thioesterase-like n=1 Tax=Panulirus ornatus TaxID=150431 RepID=UPI003A8BCCF4